MAQRGGGGEGIKKGMTAGGEDSSGDLSDLGRSSRW